MFLDNYLLYLLVSYISIFIFIEMLIKKKLPPALIVFTNMVFTYFLLKDVNYGEILNSREFFVTMVLIGSTYVAYTKKYLSIHILNIQLLIALMFLNYDNILFNTLGLLIISNSLGDRSKESYDKILEILFTITLLLISVLQIIWSQGLDIKSLSDGFQYNNILAGLFSFLVLYAPTRVYYSLNSIENNEPQDLSNQWIWLGVYLNYFLFLNKNINISEILPSNSINLISIVLIIFAVLFLFKIENLKSNRTKFIAVFTSNQLLLLYFVFKSSTSISAVYFLNYVLLLIYMLSIKSKIWGSENKNRNIMDYLLILIFVSFLITPPFTPWFELRFDLFKYLSTSNEISYLVILVLIIGIRFRQDMLFLIDIVRQNLSNKSKPS